jgi:glycosyltransferase involved in cell wall biosynthesis
MSPYEENIIWPKVSVVTVIFNSEKYIEETIKSVLNQNYPNLDFVIIDGGSTDKTMEIVNSYSKEISTIISEKDSGIYNAMNKSSNYCRGDWVCFLNSGDLFFDKNVLTSIFNSVSRLKPDFIYGDTSYYSLLQNFEYQRGGMVYEKDFIFKFPICHQSMFFSKNLLDKMNWYDESYSVVADWDITTRIFKNKNYKKLYINTCISKFLIDDVNWKNGRKGLWEWVLLTSRHRSKLITFISCLIFLVKYIRYSIVSKIRHHKIYNIYKKWKTKIILRFYKSEQLDGQGDDSSEYK